MNLIDMDFTNKTIALIGNGPCTHDNGKDIDEFDLVVRFNGGIITENINKNKECIGSKTSLAVWNWWVLDGREDLLTTEQKGIVRTLKNENIPVMFSIRAYLTKTSQTIRNIPIDLFNRMGEFNIASIGKIPNTIYSDCEELFKYKYPTSGLSFLIYLLKYYKPSEIRLFNWGLNGTHFFDDSFYDSTVDKDKFDLLHNGMLEYEIIKNLISFNKNLQYGKNISDNTSKGK